MKGKITFQFDDGYASHFRQVYPLFKKYGYAGCLAIIAGAYDRIGKENLLAMQDDGWEILSHSCTHPKMSEPVEVGKIEKELSESKRILESDGFKIRGFVTPCSQMNKIFIKKTQSLYDYAFTRYTRATEEPIEKLVIERPVNRYDLHRAGLASKTLDELKAYVDYVHCNDSWLVFYDHDLGVGNDITQETLEALLVYIKEKDVAVMTSSEALDSEKCYTKILREGWNGKECYVHARIGSDGGDKMLITTQKMTTAGCDFFHELESSFSKDGGRTWTDLIINKTFTPFVNEKEQRRYICCDMTPMYHKKTGKFIATGHQAVYNLGELVPVSKQGRNRQIPYAVYDEEKQEFTEKKILKMPEEFTDVGSGCSQCLELENGDILMPISYLKTENGEKQPATVSVIRLSFDGSELKLLDIGNPLYEMQEGPKELLRGIGEAGIIKADGKFILTIRGNLFGFVSESEDGIHFTQPKKWCWDDGEVVPTYCTQSHVFSLQGRPYLVYTRKNGTNDHVFRHRAPLYVAQIDTQKLCLKRDTEFIAVCERGARLGNFGACTVNENKAVVLVTEWMQPQGCEKYGSDNAMWMTEIQR